MTLAFKNAPLIFTDLDDTLFQSERKFSDDKPFTQVTPASIDRHGEPHGFMNQRQKNLFTWLNHSAELIPVTARTSEQLRRVTLPFPSYKIASHGAVILDNNGLSLPLWHERIQHKMTQYRQDLMELSQRINALITNPHYYCKDLPPLDAWCRLNKEEDEPRYLTFKAYEHQDADKLAHYVDWLSDEMDLTRFTLHHNDNLLQWIPCCFSKEKAVLFLLQQYYSDTPSRPIISMGDSLTDLPFMQHGDLMAIPSNSQIAKEVLLSSLNS